MTSLKRLTKTSTIWLALLSMLSMAVGCSAGAGDKDPSHFLFPTGMAVSPDSSVLFVVSGNSELREDAGRVSVVDLEIIDMTSKCFSGEATEGECEGFQLPESCANDDVLPGTLQCSSTIAVRDSAGVLIGNFATSIGVQEFASGDLRLFVSVRGDPSITWMDYSSVTGDLSCGGDDDAVLPDCAPGNRLLNLLDDVEQPTLLGEPYSMFVDSTNGYVAITHQLQGAVTLIDAPTAQICNPTTGEGCPKLSDTLTNLFEFNSESGRAALGIAGRRPGSASDLLYVTSRSEDRVVMLSVYDNGRTRALAKSEHFFLQGVAASDDARGLAFNADGSRLHIVNRDPAVLHIYDTSDGPDGFPRNQFVGGVELCSDASNIEVANLGRGDRAYVSCFPLGQIWVIDPRTETLDAIVDVGRGPHAIALSEQRGRLYVANFLEDTIAVIDITPGSATENRVLMRLNGHDESGDE